jgi:hypothetical protein
VIFAGGFGASGASNVVDIYDETTNSWTTTTLSQPRAWLAAATVGTKVFFAGGYQSSSGESNVIDIYDISTGTWTTAALSIARSNVAVAVIGSSVFFAGGETSTIYPNIGYSNVVDIYNNDTNTWTTATLSLARSELAAASLGGKAFFAGGVYESDSYFTDVVDIYDMSCTPPVIKVSPSVSICAGDTVHLSASGATTYSWKPATGLVDTTGNKIVARPMVTTVYTVKGTTIVNCSNTKTVTVTVKDLPVFTVSPTLAICAGASTPIAAVGEFGYTWSPAESLSAAIGNTVIASPTTTTVYKVTATGSNGCSSSKTIEVRINSLPILGLTNNVSICKGDSTNLIASGASTYSWSPATGLSATTGNKVKASPSLTTNYLVSGTDQNNCTSTKNVTVNVKEVPAKPTITSARTDSGDILLIISSSTSGNQWYKDNEMIQGATSQILPIQSGGTFSVQANLDGCLSPMSDQFPVIITQIQESSDNSGAFIYPNPVEKILKIDWSKFKIDQSIEVTIFDLTGRPVLETNLSFESNILNVGDLSPGVYVLRARQGNMNCGVSFLKN